MANLPIAERQWTRKRASATFPGPLPLTKHYFCGKVALVITDTNNLAEETMRFIPNTSGEEERSGWPGAIAIAKSKRPEVSVHT